MIDGQNSDYKDLKNDPLMIILKVANKIKEARFTQGVKNTPEGICCIWSFVKAD